MQRRPTESTRTGPLFPFTTPLRPAQHVRQCARDVQARGARQQDADRLALLTRDRSALSCHSFCRRLGHRGVGAGSALRPDVDSEPRDVALHEEQSVGTDFRHAMALDERRRMFRRSEEHTSELQSLMRISYAVFCLNKKNTNK